MRRSVTTIVGLGVLGSLCLAIMSMVYLQRVPGKTELARLTEDIRREHGLYLSAVAPVDCEVVRQEGQPPGMRVHVTMRPDVRGNPVLVDAYLDRIGESILEHPDWRSYLRWVTVIQEREVARSRTKTRAPRGS